MTSNDESKATRKRVGRKRLPPLAPGPALQFVVASHPDDFKAEDTMRNIRSHVMYQQRGEQQDGSRSPPQSRNARPNSRPISMTSTPSPMAVSGANSFEGSVFLAPPTQRRSTLWDEDFYRLLSKSPLQDPARHLSTRILAASTAAPAPSASPIFDQGSEYPFLGNSLFGQESLDDLKNLYINQNSGCQDRAWMETVCSNTMSFLSNVCANCVYQDLLEGLLDDSPLTVYAKTKVLPMVHASLREPSTLNDDFTALSILHLLVSEIGGFDEEAVAVHQEGLARIVHQRGGVRNLGMNGRITTFLTVVLLSYSILRGQPEPPMLRDFFPSRRQSTLMEQVLPISPLFAPSGNLSALYGICSDSTYGILSDMHDLTRLFVLRCHCISDGFPLQSSVDLDLYDTQMEQIYNRLLQLRPTNDDIAPDWIYESCRLASLIYCRSIILGLPLADSADFTHAQGGGTLLTALHHALDNTDKSSNWANMCGVFLWICLVGGAASWPSQQSHPQSSYGYGAHNDTRLTTAAWSRKFFGLYAVKSSLACGFEDAAASVEAQRTMLQVLGLISLKGGISGQ